MILATLASQLLELIADYPELGKAEIRLVTCCDDVPLDKVLREEDFGVVTLSGVGSDGPGVRDFRLS